MASASVGVEPTNACQIESAERDAGNELTSLALDFNVHISEYKTLTCDIVPGRRPRGRALAAFVEGYRKRAGIEA